MKTIMYDTLPPNEENNIESMYKKEIDNSLANSLNYFDQITLNYIEYQHINHLDGFYSDLYTFMDSIFLTITKQIKALFCLSDYN